MSFFEKFIYIAKFKITFSVINFLKYNFSKLFNLSYFQYHTKYGRVYLDSHNRGISKAIAYYKIREQEKFELIKSNVKENSLIIDIGSNIGVYPLLEYEMIGNKGFLVVIEPDKRNFKTLLKNLEKIDSSKYLFLPLAVSDDGKPKKFNITNETNLNSIGTSGNVNLIDTITIKQILRKIDKKFDEIFIRMDIEGYEVVILNNILNNLSCFKKVNIIFENHPDKFLDYNYDISEILTKLNKNGFYINYIVSSGFNTRKDKSLFHPLQFSKEYFSDGWFRYLFETQEYQKEAIKLIAADPKKVRYVSIFKN